MPFARESPANWQACKPEAVWAMIGCMDIDVDRRDAARALGRLGGKASGKVWTPAKLAASKANGAKGGRPKASGKVAAPQLSDQEVTTNT